MNLDCGLISKLTFQILIEYKLKQQHSKLRLNMYLDVHVINTCLDDHSLDAVLVWAEQGLSLFLTSFWTR